MDINFADSDGTIKHQNLAPETVEYRDYQVELAREAAQTSSLVALPTGVGKTIVSLLVSAELLSRTHSGEQALFVAPTKPLVKQQADSYRELLSIPESEIVTLTGDTPPEKRAEQWDESTVVFATPQTVKNDLLESRISLDSVCHLTIDECHKATGDYAYVYIAETYSEQRETGLVTGLSASPATERDEILEVCGNIYVNNILVRTEEDESLKKYLHETTVSAEFVDIDDEIIEMRDLLQEAYKSCLKIVKSNGYIDTASKTTNQYKLRQAQANAREAINSRGTADTAKKSMSLIAECMKLKNAIDLIDSQGVQPLYEYLTKQQKEARSDDASWATERLVDRNQVRQAYKLAEDYSGTHPKKKRLHTEVARTHIDGGRVIVFSEYRNTVRDIVSHLNQELPDSVTIHKFVGQQDKKGGDGMTQSQQQSVLQEFENGAIDVLVSTSIGEEGLDIPQVERVIFYEPVGSGIRTIQRRGRTGRQTSGEVTILVGKGTRDEGDFYRAKSNEDKMNESLSELQSMKEELIAELAEKHREDDSESHLESLSPDPQNSPTQENSRSSEEKETTITGQENLAEFMTGDDSGDSTSQANSQQAGSQLDRESPSESPPKQNKDANTSEEGKAPEIDTAGEGTSILVDKRELRSDVVEHLDKAEGIEFETEMLEVGDYVVSDNCAIERKSASDLASTISGGDRDAFEQIKALSSSYESPILLLEGTLGELYSSNIPDVALRGMLNSFILDFGVHIQFARTQRETAYHIENLAQREQDDSETTVQAHGSKETDTLADQQVYTVSSMSNIGTKTAKKLLNSLGSVKAVFTASKSELTDIKGIGEATADKIIRISQSEYE